MLRPDPDLTAGQPVDVLIDTTWRPGHLVAGSHVDDAGTWWHVTYLDARGQPRTTTVPSTSLRRS